MYAFGAFELDPLSHELRRGGVRLKVQDQPFTILMKLLERPGQLVTREQLRTALWTGDTFVDFDTSLNSAVKRLREALGDSAEAPRYIETLPKLGYRFVAPVEVRSLEPRTAPSRVEPQPDKVGRRVPWHLWATAAAALLACAAALLFYVRSRGAPLVAMEVVPLTGMTGLENDAAFSPDGNHVAFTLSEPADRAGVYIMMIGGEKPLRLTEASTDCCLVWSPDGRAVAFSRMEQGNYTIYAVPALGGTPKVLYSNRVQFPGHVSMWPIFSWSPDGAQLAVSTPSRLAKALFE